MHLCVVNVLYGTSVYFGMVVGCVCMCLCVYFVCNYYEYFIVVVSECMLSVCLECALFVPSMFLGTLLVSECVFLVCALLCASLNCLYL